MFVTWFGVMAILITRTADWLPYTLIVAGLTAGVVISLRTEIRTERAILDRARIDSNDVKRRPVSSQHIRRVSIWSTVVVVVFSTLLALVLPSG
jgi:hypothetical protein